MLCYRSSAVAVTVDPFCVSFITILISIVLNRPWGFSKSAGGGRCCWQTLEKPVLLLLTLFLDINKKDCSKKKKKKSATWMHLLFQRLHSWWKANGV